MDEFWQTELVRVAKKDERERIIKLLEDECHNTTLGIHEISIVHGCIRLIEGFSEPKEKKVKLSIADLESAIKISRYFGLSVDSILKYIFSRDDYI